jgi:pre-mRNA-splicing factor RBM22/SLT11
MASIKRDAVKQSWESQGEFPLVCETCLGDNPYVRMTVEAHGKKCQICENPFTVFAWQAGTKGRLKRVEICKSCAQAKNVCQVCIYDLQYGLPVKVRDRVLRDNGSSAGAISAVPQSNANRAWYTAQQQRAIEQGNVSTDVTVFAHAKLQDMARMEPRYERNLPKLCSFFAKGECDRGSNCPFRHEMPRDRNDPLSQQNTKDRFYGTNDPVANKIIGRKRRQEQQQQQQAGAGEDGFDVAKTSVYVRFQGEPPYPNLSEMEVRDQFYAFGEISSVRMQMDKGQLFIEYTQSEAAELAIASMNRKELCNRMIYSSWARTLKRGDIPMQQQHPRRGDTNDSSVSATPTTGVVIRPVAPPGGGISSSIASKPIPQGFLAALKPPPKVVANTATIHSSSLDSIDLTNPAVKRVATEANNKPYYSSADPGRLGTNATSSSA